MTKINITNYRKFLTTHYRNNVISNKARYIEHTNTHTTKPQTHKHRNLLKYNKRRRQRPEMADIYRVSTRTTVKITKWPLRFSGTVFRGKSLSAETPRLYTIEANYQIENSTFKRLFVVPKFGGNLRKMKNHTEKQLRFQLRTTTTSVPNWKTSVKTIADFFFIYIDKSAGTFSFRRIFQNKKWQERLRLVDRSTLWFPNGWFITPTLLFGRQIMGYFCTVFPSYYSRRLSLELCSKTVNIESKFCYFFHIYFRKVNYRVFLYSIIILSFFVF